MSYFVIIKELILDILWYVDKQTFSEECIKIVILMKLEGKIGLRCIRNIILNMYSKGDVCATIWEKVANCPTNHRSADRCHPWHIYYRMTDNRHLFSP